MTLLASLKAQKNFVYHDKASTTRHLNTVELQWLEHRWLVYHGYFELVLESLGKNPIAADNIIFGIIEGDFLLVY